MQSINKVDSAAELTQQYASLLQVLCRIGTIYSQQGKLNEANKIFGLGEQMLETNDIAPRDETLLLISYGKILTRTIFEMNVGQEKARAIAFRAREVAESTQDQRLVADAEQLLGEVDYYQEVWKEQGDYARVLEHVQRALRMRESIGDTRGSSESLFYLGLIHQRRGQADEALGYYKKGLEITRQHGYKQEQSYLTRHIGGYYLDKGELDTALRYCQESLALREEAGLKTLLPFAYLLVGNVYEAKHEYDTAQTYYQQAYTLAQELEQKIDIIFSLLSLGDLQRALQDKSRARAYYEQAQAEAKEINFALGMNIAGKKLSGEGE